MTSRGEGWTKMLFGPLASASTGAVLQITAQITQPDEELLFILRPESWVALWVSGQWLMEDGVYGEVPANCSSSPEQVFRSDFQHGVCYEECDRECCECECDQDVKGCDEECDRDCDECDRECDEECDQDCDECDRECCEECDRECDEECDQECDECD
ncbi:hypothetical protein Baya_14866 [Bagarius yarrelli]|uniref:Uncharacterized protein n=1 Tax=Bagarius yarrelli TaxID=175774 RepID=A0A556VA38_BAGYA|nr:hypothetical protein Baya_14866 [Bagarius yarrelli]